MAPPNRPDKEKLLHLSLEIISSGQDGTRSQATVELDGPLIDFYDYWGSPENQQIFEYIREVGGSDASYKKVQQLRDESSITRNRLFRLEKKIGGKFGFMSHCMTIEDVMADSASLKAINDRAINVSAPEAVHIFNTQLGKRFIYELSLQFTLLNTYELARYDSRVLEYLRRSEPLPAIPDAVINNQPEKFKHFNEILDTLLTLPIDKLRIGDARDGWRDWGRMDYLIGRRVFDFFRDPFYRNVYGLNNPKEVTSKSFVDALTNLLR